MAFADAYFNWQFPTAVGHCTPESRRWLSYMASQVNQQDVDALRAMTEGAGCKVEDVEMGGGDSTATALVCVRHYLSMDTLGQTGKVVDEARFVVPMVRRRGKWLVSLSAPLRERRD